MARLDREDRKKIKKIGIGALVGVFVLTVLAMEVWHGTKLVHGSCAWIWTIIQIAIGLTIVVLFIRAAIHQQMSVIHEPGKRHIDQSEEREEDKAEPALNDEEPLDDAT